MALRHTRRRIVYCHTHPTTPEAPVGTEPSDIPDELARLLGWGYTLSTADDGHTQVDVLANVRSQS
jgi:hypothetical protein